MQCVYKGIIIIGFVVLIEFVLANVECEGCEYYLLSLPIKIAMLFF